jgi:hypothetical protein
MLMQMEMEIMKKVKFWKQMLNYKSGERQKEDAVAVLNVAEDVRMESDGGAFLVGLCNGEGPEDGNEDYDDYNVENDDGVYAECFEDEEDNNNEDNDQTPTETVSADGSSLQLPCNGFQDFDNINLFIQEIAKSFYCYK